MSHHRRAVTDVEGAPGAVGPYSVGMVAGGLLFCSGQVGLDPETNKLVEGDAGAQAGRCLSNLDAVCRKAGASLADAVRVTVWLTDMGDWAGVNEVYAGFFPDTPPARVAVAVAALPLGAAVEIDAIVALPD